MVRYYDIFREFYVFDKNGIDSCTDVTEGSSFKASSRYQQTSNEKTYTMTVITRYAISDISYHLNKIILHLRLLDDLEESFGAADVGGILSGEAGNETEGSSHSYQSSK